MKSWLLISKRSEVKCKVTSYVQMFCPSFNGIAQEQQIDWYATTRCYFKLSSSLNLPIIFSINPLFSLGNVQKVPSNCFFLPANSLKPKDFSFTDKERQQILTFKSLEPANV